MVCEKKRFNYNFILLLAIPYLIPNGLVQFSFYSIVSKLKYFSIIFILLFICQYGKIKINRLARDWFVFSLALIVITSIKGGDIVGSIKQGVDIIFPLLWADLCLEYDHRKTLKLLHGYYSMIAILNFILIILFPSGIIETTSTNAVNLLGDDNKMLFTLLPAMGISFFYILTYREKKKRQKLLIVTALIYMISVAYIWAVTGLMAFLLVLIMYFVDRHSETAKKVFNLRNCVIAIAVIFYLAVFSNSFQEGVIGRFITDVLNKPVNFSGRTTLWVQAVAKIMKAPITGYGYGQENIYAFSFSGASGLLSGFSCHDGYLRLLLEGGIVILCLYVIIHFNLYRNCKRIWKNNDSIHILVFAMTGFLLGCIFEAEYYSFLYLVLLGVLYGSRNMEESRVK